MTAERRKAKPTRVLIVDAKADIRSILHTRLHMEPDMEVVGEAANGSQAVHMARSLRPDIVLLDLGLSDMPGDEAIQALRSLLPLVWIVEFCVYPSAAQRPPGCQRPAAWVGKDRGLAPLVSELHRVRSRMPAEVAERARPGRREPLARALGCAAFVLPPSERARYVEELCGYLAETAGRRARLAELLSHVGALPGLAADQWRAKLGWRR
jgi:CheY-like chemotaxis protein